MAQSSLLPYLWPHMWRLGGAQIFCLPLTQTHTHNPGIRCLNIPLVEHFTVIIIILSTCILKIKLFAYAMNW